MTRLAIKVRDTGRIFNINLDSVAWYDIGIYDKEANQCSLEFYFNCERKIRFICEANVSKSFIHSEIKMCVASGDLLEVESIY